MHGPLVLHSTTKHPRPYRIEYGVCHTDNGQATGVSRLVSYPATSVPASLWSKRHLPPVLFLLVAHVCNQLRPHVPQLQQAEPFPNSITVHFYPSATTPGNERGNTRVGYHTDSYSATGARVAQRDKTPVISISFGETMWFWARSSTEAFVVTALEHGSVWIWTSKDDKSGSKHSVCYPPDEHQPNMCNRRAKGEGRWVAVCRWIDTLREYQNTTPHRNLSGMDCVWLD